MAKSLFVDSAGMDTLVSKESVLPCEIKNAKDTKLITSKAPKSNFNFLD